MQFTIQDDFKTLTKHKHGQLYAYLLFVVSSSSKGRLANAKRIDKDVERSGRGLTDVEPWNLV